MGLTYEQLIAQGAKPIQSTTTSTSGLTYEQLIAQGATPADVKPTVTASTQTTPNDLLNNPITNTIQKVFPGAILGKAIGNSIADIQKNGLMGNKAQEQDQQFLQLLQSLKTKAQTQGKDTTHYDNLIQDLKPSQSVTTQDVTPLQIAGDVGQIGLTAFTPNIGAGFGVGGRILANAGLGAALGATNAIANGGGLKDTATQTALGGVTGGVLGGLGELVTSAAEKLPTRLIRNLLPQLKNPETIDYAINKTKIGSVNSMVETSDKALQSYNSQIKAILSHPDISSAPSLQEIGKITPESLKVSGGQVSQDVLKSFPNSEYTPDYIFSKIKSQVPGSSKLISKLQNSSITLDEANTLRQAVDRVTYKTIIDSPEIKAGKDIAEKFGNALRTQVQTKAPETASIFSNYSKEINLQKALVKLQNKTSKAAPVSLKEILGVLGVSGALGPIAGGAALGTEKVLTSPAGIVSQAKLLKAATPLIKGAAVIGKAVGAQSGRIPIKKQN